MIFCLVVSGGLVLGGPGSLLWENFDRDIALFQRQQFLESVSPAQFSQVFANQSSETRAQSAQFWAEFIAKEESNPNVSPLLRGYSEVRQSPRGLIYFHGFSASNKELSPVLENVAEDLGDSLMMHRMFDHGIQGGELARLTTEDYLRNSFEWIWLASRSFQEVVPVGMSTGATQALFGLSKVPELSVKKMVLIAPNFGISPGVWPLVTGPLGRQALQWFLGPHYAWEFKSEDHARFWTARMRSSAVAEMLQFVWFVKQKSPELHWAKNCEVLVIQNPLDQVVDNQQAREFIAKLGFKSVTYREVAAENHVLAGDVVTPQNTQALTQIITEFLQKP